MLSSQLGDTSCGVWTRAQALRVLGVPEVDHLVATGVWQVAWAGVYADAGYELDAEQRAFAAVLACGGDGQPAAFGPPDPVTGNRRQRLVAVACGRTAARVWGLPLVDDEDPATGASERRFDEVAVWRSSREQRRQDRLLVPRRLRFGNGELVRRASGLWLTSPLRTLVDCARLLTHQAAVCALDDALRRQLVTMAQLDAAVAARRGLAGASALRRAVMLADGRAEAPSETLTRLLLLPVLPALRPQVELYDARGRLVARFDLADEEVQLAVEADGKAGHAGDRMVAKDRRRDRRTEVLGWSTERVTWFDVRRQQEATRARVIAAHARHRTRRDIA